MLSHKLSLESVFDQKDWLMASRNKINAKKSQVLWSKLVFYLFIPLKCEVAVFTSPAFSTKKDLIEARILLSVSHVW